MAEVRIEGDEVVVHLSPMEKVGAVHGEPRAPLASVTGARAVADAWTELRGMRSPGTGFPGEMMLGTTRGQFGRDFCAVSKHQGGVVVEMEGQEFKRFLVSTDSSEQVVAALGF